MLSFYLALIDDPADHEVFIEFYNSFEKSMYFIAKKYLNDDHLAEDAVQDSLTRIARSIKRIKNLDENQKRKYALTAAKNAALDIIKTRNKINSVSIEEFYSLADNIATDEISDNEKYGYVIQVLESLPQKYRDVLYMKLVLGFSEKEIAASLNLKLNTVRQHVLRGREKFAKLYEKETYKNEL